MPSAPLMQDLPKPVLLEEERNPYAPPKTESVPDPLTVDLLESYELASKGKRFLNYVVDRAAIYGLLVVLGGVLGVAEGMGYIEGFSEWLDNLGGLANMLLTGLFSVVYYWIMESVWGRTLGKLVTGTKVISDAGLPARPLAILGRSLARYVPFEPFSMLGSAAWHDSWSGTQVIDLRKKTSSPVSASAIARRKYFP